MQLKVYTDPTFPSNKLLLGFKGQTFLDSGFISAPFVPNDPPRVNTGDLALMVAEFLKGHGYLIEDVNFYLHVTNSQGTKLCVMVSDDHTLMIRRYDQAEVTKINSADPDWEPGQLLPMLQEWSLQVKPSKL